MEIQRREYDENKVDAPPPAMLPFLGPSLKSNERQGNRERLEDEMK